MSNVTDLSKYRETRDKSPTVVYEKEIQNLLRDINISKEPTIEAEGRDILLTWQSSRGILTVEFSPSSGHGDVLLIDASGTPILHGHVHLGYGNRWIGYLWDDNFS